jgi:hypothetical protein
VESFTRIDVSNHALWIEHVIKAESQQNINFIYYIGARAVWRASAKDFAGKTFASTQT